MYSDGQLKKLSVIIPYNQVTTEHREPDHRTQIQCKRLDSSVGGNTRWLSGAVVHVYGRSPVAHDG